MTTPSPSRLREHAATLLFATLFAVTSAAPVVAQTTPGGLAPAAGFGGVTAVGTGEVFVGAAPIGWPTGAEPAGAVHTYGRDNDGIWIETGTIRASDGEVGDHFGRSVGVEGDLLVVGAPGVAAAYVFQKRGGVWTEHGKLAPSVLTGDAEFGGAYARAGSRSRAVTFVGDRIAVAAVGSDSASSAVHVFARQGEIWTEEAILKPESPEDAAGFGWSIAGSENTIFVGANLANERTGAVYAFARDGVGNSQPWIQKQRIAPAELSERAGFGQYVASVSSADGTSFYVGAPGHAGAGAIFVFEADESGSWQETARVAGPAPAEGEQRFGGGFGTALAVSETHLLVAGRSGVFALKLDDLAASPTIIEAPDDRSRAGFGTSLAVNRDVAAIGSPGADYEAGIANVFEFDDLGVWNAAGVLAPELSYIPSISGGQVDCTDGSAGLFDCDNVDLLSFVSAGELTSARGVKMTDMWGWEDPDTGKEWVLQARTDGTSFVDISDPNNPVYVGQMYRTEGSPGSTWRDVKVYKNHAYVVADGARDHGVQVFDLTRLRSVDPADMPITFTPDTTYHGVASSHNIVINEDSGFAYAVGNGSGGETCGGQLHIIDIRDPKNPTFAGCFNHQQGGTHDSQCVIYHGRDADYAGREVCFSSNGSSFVIADVTRKDSTTLIAASTYPNVAYTHQGWLTEDHNHFYMNDELDEMNGLTDQTRTLIWDLSDLDDPQLAKEYYLNSGASDHNLYIRGDYLYESNYQAGLRILDISDRLNPVEVGNFDTAPYAEDEAGFGGSWSNYPYFRSGVIAVSSRNEGLFILRHRQVDS